MKQILVCLLLAAAHLQAHADFVNLDFESYTGSGEDYLPGWSRNSANYIWPLYDTFPLATSGLGLVSTNSGYGYIQPYEGDYSAYVSAGVGQVPDSSTYIPVQLYQAETVPLDAGSLSFVLLGYDPANVSYSFTLDTIDLLAGTSEDIGGGHIRFTQDISSLAGSNATLSFGFQFTGGGGASPSRDHTLDDISFGTIPEPSSLAMLFLGLFALTCRRKRK